ncbi:HNH endonuclease [Maridesulfovibrio sp.]|uniref:HNH endonuclease n=1 Tax=unclassified Maridesulfovibrio TaxID=2794999 RepID=UPI003B00E398
MGKKNNAAVVFVVIVIAAIAAIVSALEFLLMLAVTYWYFLLAIGLIILAAVYGPTIIRRIRKNHYFKSEDFLARKKQVAELVSEHNDIAEYVQNIRENGSFEIGVSSTGEHSHLASFENTSKHKYKRDRNVSNFGVTNVHNCSLQVARNAAMNPIKYLMKYFDIKPNEETLVEVEALGENISRLASAIHNLKERESSIATTFAPPDFILKYFHDEFMQHVGVELSPVLVPYPEYAFEYVSAGGNSAQKTTVRLDLSTIDALIETLSEKIRFRKSVAGQRALMTAKFREFIKKRDGYTCKHCSVSVMDEPHLLLEVDHIMPISKGGLSTEDNLQTLCWRCNRSKSNKVMAN